MKWGNLDLLKDTTAKFYTLTQDNMQKFEEMFSLNQKCFKLLLEAVPVGDNTFELF